MTFPLKDAEEIKKVMHVWRGWQFSQIHGCPIMGAKTYCYLTAYSTDAVNLQRQMETIVRGCQTFGIDVLRQKIERIVYDTKTGVNEL